jgi:hypothetical protein
MVFAFIVEESARVADPAASRAEVILVAIVLMVELRAVGASRDRLRKRF